jgi:hypothetical protein
MNYQGFQPASPNNGCDVFCFLCFDTRRHLRTKLSVFTEHTLFEIALVMAAADRMNY